MLLKLSTPLPILPSSFSVPVGCHSPSRTLACRRPEEGSVYNEQLGQVLQSMVTHTKEERLKLAGGTLSTSEGHVLYLKPDLFVEDWLKQNQALASTYSPCAARSRTAGSCSSVSVQLCSLAWLSLSRMSCRDRSI
eukprot:2519160-Pleurochrysis_carterae.AAC.1